jgi:chaperone modulatory protein CbpM
MTSSRGPTRCAIVRSPVRQPALLDLESFARAADLHPDLVRRLVALGLLDASRGADGELRFPPTQLAVAARLQRLRAGLTVNYAALGVIVQLLDRIEQLEHLVPARARTTRPNGGRRWT